MKEDTLNSLNPKIMYDLSKALIRCSSLACLFTEPQAKADKEAGLLSKTAKSHLIETYAREIWGIEQDITTPQMKKGTIAEEDGITTLSRVDKRFYTKNTERKENEWLSGHADIVEEDEIVDIKLSWNALTFLPKLIEPIDKVYEYQLQGYMWLYNKPKGRISYCLVDTPDNIIQSEKYRLLRSMDVVSEEDPSYQIAARKLESNMKFSHIPPELRVINHYVDRDDEIIAKIPAKVERAREFLIELAEKHLSYYPQSVAV